MYNKRCTSKMNIITIAFCLQFVIACWPKTDVTIGKAELCQGREILMDFLAGALYAGSLMPITSF